MAWLRCSRSPCDAVSAALQGAGPRRPAEDPCGCRSQHLGSTEQACHSVMAQGTPSTLLRRARSLLVLTAASRHASKMSRFSCCTSSALGPAATLFSCAPLPRARADGVGRGPFPAGCDARSLRHGWQHGLCAGCRPAAMAALQAPQPLPGTGASSCMMMHGSVRSLVCRQPRPIRWGQGWTARLASPSRRCSSPAGHGAHAGVGHGVPGGSLLQLHGLICQAVLVLGDAPQGKLLELAAHAPGQRRPHWTALLRKHMATICLRRGQCVVPALLLPLRRSCRKPGVHSRDLMHATCCQRIDRGLAQHCCLTSMSSDRTPAGLCTSHTRRVSEPMAVCAVMHKTERIQGRRAGRPTCSIRARRSLRQDWCTRPARSSPTSLAAFALRMRSSRGSLRTVT